MAEVDMFGWQDICVIVCVLIGAFWSSRKMPGLNSDSTLVNFAKELMTTVSIANFCTIIYAKDISRMVHLFFVNEEIPFYAYALVICAGVVVLISAIFQPILVKIQAKSHLLYFFVPSISVVELAILTHLLYIA